MQREQNSDSNIYTYTHNKQMWWLLLLPTAYGYSTKTSSVDFPEPQTPGDIIFDVNNPFQYDITYAYNTSSQIVTHYNNPEISICAGTYKVKSTSSSHPLYFAGVPVDTEFVTIDLNGLTTYACRNHPTMSNNIKVDDCSTSTMDGICDQACPMCDIGFCDSCGSCTCSACATASDVCSAQCSSCNDCNDWTGYTNKKECLDTKCPDCYSCRHPECEYCIDCDCFDTTPYGLFKCQQCMVGETSCSTCNIDLYNLSLPDCDCSDCPWDTIETCSYEDNYGTCADNEDGNCRTCFECHGFIATTTTTQAPTTTTTQAPTTTTTQAPTAPADAYTYGIIDIMLCPNDPDITLVWSGYHNIKRIVNGEFVEETLSDFLNKGAVRTIKAADLSDWGATTKWGCSLHPTGRITTTCITVLPTFTAQQETIATSTIVGGGAVALMLIGMGIMAISS